ncbi:MAG: hypothetical protein ACREDO_04625 [Methyloceanibacter sp.]
MIAANRWITVCAACLTKACHDGVFRCDRSGDAGIIRKSTEELRELGLEHEDYWEEEPRV